MAKSRNRKSNKSSSRTSKGGRANPKSRTKKSSNSQRAPKAYYTLAEDAKILDQLRKVSAKYSRS